MVEWEIPSLNTEYNYKSLQTINDSQWSTVKQIKLKILI